MINKKLVKFKRKRYFKLNIIFAKLKLATNHRNMCVTKPKLDGVADWANSVSKLLCLCVLLSAPPRPFGDVQGLCNNI